MYSIKCVRKTILHLKIMKFVTNSENRFQDSRSHPQGFTQGHEDIAIYARTEGHMEKMTKEHRKIQEHKEKDIMTEKQIDSLFKNKLSRPQESPIAG